MKQRKFIITFVMAITMLFTVGCSENNDSIPVEKNMETTLEQKTGSVATELTTASMKKAEDETVVESKDEELIYDYDSAVSVTVELEDEKRTENLKAKVCEIAYDDILFFSEGLCPYQDSRTGLWGYLDTDFNIAIKPVYVEACCFSEGLAAVHDGTNWGFIDSTGNYAITPRYEKVYYKYYFHEGTSSAYRDGMRGFLNGYAAVKYYDENIYYIDKAGNTVYSEKWDLNISRCGNILYNDLKDSFCNEYAKPISKMPKVHYRTGKGTDLRNPTKYSLTDDYVIVSDIDGNDYIMDSKGNVFFSYTSLGQGDCYGTVITNQSCTFQRRNNDLYQTAVYDFRGKEIIPFYYEGVFPVCRNGDVIYYIGFFRNGESELLDKSGNVLDYEWFDTSQRTVIRCCEELGSVQGNYAIVYTQDNLKLVNLDTNTVMFEYSGMNELPMPDRNRHGSFVFSIDYNLGIAAINNDYLIIQNNSYEYLIFNMNGDVVGKYSGQKNAFDVSMKNINNGVFHGYDASINNRDSMNIFRLDGITPSPDVKSENAVLNTSSETDDIDLTNVLIELAKNPNAKINEAVLDSITSIEIIGDKYYSVNTPASTKYNFDFHYPNGDQTYTIASFDSDPITHKYGTLSNIDFVKKLKNLKSITVSYNEIRDISALENLNDLTVINLMGNRIKDISPLSKFTNVVELNVCENRIEDISVLKIMPKLNSLTISGNNISDISVLNNNRELTFLALGDNPIRNIDSIIILEKLSYLSVYNTNISESDLKILRQTFPDDRHIIK